MKRSIWMKLALAAALATPLAAAMGCEPAASEDREVIESFYSGTLTVSPGDTDEEVRERFETLLADDFQSIAMNGVDPAQISDREGMIQGVLAVRALVPDLRWEPQEILQDGDRYIVRGRARGTTQGQFLGLDLPEPRPFDIMSIDVHTVVDGQIQRVYHVEEWATAVQQLTAQ